MATGNGDISNGYVNGAANGKVFSNGTLCNGTVLANGELAAAHARKSCRTRVYEAKQSLIDELSERDSNVRAAQLIVSVQIVLFIACSIAWQSYHLGWLHISLWTFLGSFGTLIDISRFAILEAFLLLCTMLVHPLFKLWVRARQSLPHLVMDGLFAVLYLGAALGSFFLTIHVCDSFSFPPFLRVTASIENVRVCMKSYSFIRENAYKVLYPWHKDDKSGPAVWYRGQMSPSVGSFQQYCYYLFCPAVLYRDHYPRNSSIQWRKAALYLLYFLTSLWCCYSMAEMFLMPATLSYPDVLQCFLRNIMFGFPSLLFAHTLAIHSWQNFTAELTLLADRQFYSDWWSSTHLGEFYRKWNLLVYEYIHQYLYRDINSVIGKRNLISFLSIGLSAVLHEYMISMGTGFFCPLLFIVFGVCGAIFYMWPAVKTRSSRTWVTMFFLSGGQGFLSALYILEVKARRLCIEDDMPEIVGLRMFHCIAQHNL